ncbi:ATP-binding protein [Pedobacter jejuensis]|nr:ATP-binding protein [Pedobacter jejuensis]
MNISQLIDKNYYSCSILQDMEGLFKFLKDSLYLVVIDKELKVAGIVNQIDLINHPTGRIIDFDFSKPSVSTETSIVDVYNLMASSCANCLPVYDNMEFMGVISINHLSHYLLNQYKKHDLIYQRAIHDLRNPISNIIGLNSLLEDSIQEPENIEIIDLTKTAGNHALEILNKLLFIEKHESDQYKLEITDLNYFVRECLTELKGILSNKQVQLLLSLSNEKFPYLIDRMHFKRAIHNVVSNAIKFSYPNGTIYGFTQISGNTFTLKIVDSGIGIPLEKQLFVFDQFTESSLPGTIGESSTGLGLYLAKNCIERLKGKIWFDSVEGQGTTFFVEFKA